jgi:hypothetical protein
MRAVRLNAIVTADRCLQIEVPREIPPGEIELILFVSEAIDVQAEPTLREFFTELDRMPHKRLTREEVDLYLATERASWD